MFIIAKLLLLHLKSKNAVLHIDSKKSFKLKKQIQHIK